MMLGMDRGVGAGGKSKSKRLAKWRGPVGVVGRGACFVGDGARRPDRYDAKSGCVWDFFGDLRLPL